MLAMPLAQAGSGTPGATIQTQPPQTSNEAGLWTAHDMVIRLNDLPRAYSCDDLRERFHDVLLALGARPQVTVSAYACGPEGYSPRVRLQFSLPARVLQAHALEVRQAQPRIVRLGPGTPRSWTAADCELMRQVKDQLISQLSPKVVSFSLACLAPPVNSEHYNVTVQVVTPASTPSRLASLTDVVKPPRR